MLDDITLLLQGCFRIFLLDKRVLLIYVRIKVTYVNIISNKELDYKEIRI